MEMLPLTSGLDGENYCNMCEWGDGPVSGALCCNAPCRVKQKAPKEKALPCVCARAQTGVWDQHFVLRAHCICARFGRHCCQWKGRKHLPGSRLPSEQWEELGLKGRVKQIPLSHFLNV